MAGMVRALLLCSDNQKLADEAFKFARERFDVCGFWKFSRHDKQLPAEVQEIADQGNIDYLFNFLSPVILRRPLLSQIRRASINFHPAPPDYPGVGSASLALFEGAKAFGATAHIIVETVDSGPILRVSRFQIELGSGCAEVFDRSLHESLVLYKDYLEDLWKGMSPQPNGEHWGRKAMTRRQFEQWMTLPEDSEPEVVRRMIAACRHPKFPGPYQMKGDERKCLSDL